MKQVRRVRRIIRKFDPWTVLKVSFVLYSITALAILLGLVIFWTLVRTAGIPQMIETTISSIGLLSDVNIIPPEEQLFRAAVFLGVAWTVLMTGFTTLGAVLYNLISDVVGGVEVIVLEETGNVPYVAAPTPQPTQLTPVVVPESDDPDISIADVPTEALWDQE
jgi:hypothetical protein